MPQHGRFVWYDLMTPDVAASVAFYERVVGWKARAVPQRADGYTLLCVGDRPVAGVMPLPAGAGDEARWAGDVAVDDVDAAVAKLGELGGTVLREATTVPGVGRFAVVRDPRGAGFCVFAPSRDFAAPEQAEVGDVVYHELYTDDREAVWPFYQALLGWQDAGGFDMGGDYGRYQLFSVGGAPLGGMANVARVHGTRPYWGYYVRTGDIEATAKLVEEAGATIANGPMEIPDGSRILQIFDPFGAAFAFNQPAAS